jgi:putative sterol carrier protein
VPGVLRGAVRDYARLIAHLGPDPWARFMSEFPEGIEKVQAKFSDPSFQERMKGFSRTIQFKFTDTGDNYLMTIKEGKLESTEKKVAPDANILIASTSELFTGIMNRTSDPMSAYFAGTLRVEGDMNDLMSLQPLLM